MTTGRDLEGELRRASDEAAQLRAENTRLRRRNSQLRARQAVPPALGTPVAVQLPFPDAPAAPPVTGSAGAAGQLPLFQTLFRGRQDVYAVRWSYPDGRNGYSPAARSRVDRQQGRFLPLTDQVVANHLRGRHTIGVYPLLRDETCWFLAADFDKEHWQEDVATYLLACDALGVPAALERSRSGNGGHVWIFFAAPVPAAQARTLGCALLTRALEHHHQLGLDSYDRLFPNQDTMPKGGFGNLIALPLQAEPRQAGNSVFLDRSFIPYPEQWAFLTGVRRLRPADVEALVAGVVRAGTVLGVRPSVADADREDDPWTLPPSGTRPASRVAGPFPTSVRVTLANLVYVATEGLPPALLSRIWRLAAFQNPEFYHAQALRLSTFGKPRVISCAEEFPRHLGLPRGCLDEVELLLADHGIAVELVEERQEGTPLAVEFHGSLTPVQQQAVDTLLAHDIGVLCAPTAFGKTVAAAWVIATRQVNTLVLVHRRLLLDQWRERLMTFLGLPATAIGQIGGGRNTPTGQLDVAVIQSLGRAGSVDDVVAQYGQVIVDECHHVPAFSVERVLKAAKARFVLGLTATPIRKDGHHPIVVMQCGPLRYRVSPSDEATARPFAQILIPRPTGFQLPTAMDVPPGIQEIYTALAANEQRNDRICADLIHAVRQGRRPLLLTERTEHLAELARRLTGAVRHLVVLQGGMGVRQRRAALAQLATIPAGEPLALLATGRYAGEGFDHAPLDTLLLALPVSWQGTVRQYAGRLHRLHPDKQEVRIYDYVDADVPVLARMYTKRLKGYRAMGYVVRAEDPDAPAGEPRPAPPATVRVVRPTPIS
jgi:superfamily II DNA or RNA helicase